MEKLKPFPFCGGTLVKPINDGFGVFVVWCLHCFAKGPATDGPLEAIEAWNRSDDGGHKNED